MHLSSLNYCPPAHYLQSNVGLLASLATLVFTITAPSVFAQKQSVPNEKTFQVIYSQRDAALKRKDVAGCMKNVASGFHTFNLDGTLHTPNRNYEQNRLVRVFGKATAIESKTTVISVSLVGKNAIVTVKNDYTRTQSDPSRGLLGKYHETGKWRDFWINTGVTWQREVSRPIVLNKVNTINGQKVE